MPFAIDVIGMDHPSYVNTFVTDLRYGQERECREFEIRLRWGSPANMATRNSSTFVWGAMLVRLLLERYLLQRGDQAQLAGIQAPRHQHRMLGQTVA